MKPQEIYTEIETENNIAIDDGDRYISLGYESALGEIEEFVEYVANNEFEIFKSEIDRRGRSIILPSDNARRCISQFGNWMKAYSERYVYSDYVDLFFRTFEIMGVGQASRV